MKQKRVTIVDVARHANVSVGTASQVLNNPEQVGPERLARVMRAIEELGYTRNRLAQGLRAKTTASIGLCVPHSRISFFADLLYRFGELALKDGLRIMNVLSLDDSAKELEQVQTVISYDVDGLLLVPSSKPQPALDFLAARRIPTVVVDRPLQEETRFDQATSDNRHLMIEVVSHLAALGHRRILFIVRRRSAAVSVQRLMGLAEVQPSLPHPIQADVIESGDTASEFTKRLDEVLPAMRPTAIIASNDVIAAWIIRELQLRGIRCPADVSLINFDEPSWAEIVTPSLSTVRLSVGEMAEAAWNLLKTRLKDPALPPRRVITPAEVVFRDSVAQAASASRTWRNRPKRPERLGDDAAA